MKVIDDVSSVLVVITGKMLQMKMLGFIFRTPFTIQRLCELVTEPTKHYKKADKFMRGVEKVSKALSTLSHKSETASHFCATVSLFYDSTVSLL